MSDTKFEFQRCHACGLYFLPGDRVMSRFCDKCAQNHPTQALPESAGSEDIVLTYFRNYWNSEAVAKHRRGLNDMQWAERQHKGPPRYKIGDVVEFHEGGFGVISEVSEPHDGWPASYATSSVPGMQTFWKSAWHYEGDFKRIVAKGALHDMQNAHNVSH